MTNLTCSHTESKIALWVSDRRELTAKKPIALLKSRQTQGRPH